MKILDSYWFSPMGGDLIGVIKAQTEYDGIKYYIGTIKTWPGESLNKKNDEITISERGAKFPEKAGKILIP